MVSPAHALSVSLGFADQKQPYWPSGTRIQWFSSSFCKFCFSKILHLDWDVVFLQPDAAGVNRQRQHSVAYYRKSTIALAECIFSFNLPRIPRRFLHSIFNNRITTL